MYLYTPGVVVRIIGNPLATAKKYVLEKLRCALCLNLFSAQLPEGVSQEKYDARFKAMLAFYKYFQGMPFHRIAMSQAMLGVPLPDSTQWSLIVTLRSIIEPVFLALERLGAGQGELVHQDDTSVKILSFLQENKKGMAQDRRGMQTSCLAFLNKLHKIYIFRSGRKHAGENLMQALSHRSQEAGPIIKMSDALASNHPATGKTIDCNCLAHGRRKFFELHPFFPEECTFVIERLAKVYAVDTETREKGMADEARLAYHVQYSTPVMEALKVEIGQKITEKLVEPNSSLGGAYRYLQNHWFELTQFLRVPGAPLDNNLVERALKVPIRNRKAALFYKTQQGALIGDMLMSLMFTAVQHDENPVDYLVALQEHAPLVRGTPESWLPWNWRDHFTERISVAA